MNEYILAGAVFFGLIAITVVIYLAIYSRCENKKRKAKIKARNKAYHKTNRAKLERECKERFDLYLLALGVK